MGRRRTNDNRRLPNNLYRRGSYYSYKCPIDGREYGIGSDKWAAIAEALRRNANAEGKVFHAPDTQLTEKIIVDTAVPRNGLCGIYFLVRGSSVVYVGQSINVYKRLSEHMGARIIDFDKYHVLPCAAELMDILETSYIAKFRPYWNKRLLVKTSA